MKTTLRKRSWAGTQKLLALMVSVCALLMVPSITHAAANDGGAITAEELQQKGYDFPEDLVSGADHSQFANYAWRLFIAAMQNTTATLTDGSSRGTPSASTSFIDSGKSPGFSSPLVFESLYGRTEAYPFYTGSKPASPVGQPPLYYTYYENDGQQPLTIKNGPYVFLDETNQIGQNFLYYRKSNDPDFPVLFMAKSNQTGTEYVRGVTTAPSSSKPIFFPNDSMEMKTAWRRVSDIKNSDPNKYHQAKAIYYSADESGNVTQQTDVFALIAIHIIQKTANYQQYIFSTFEHVDSVTLDGETIVDPAYQLAYDTLAYGISGGGNPPYTATVHGAYSMNVPGLSGGTDANVVYDLPAPGATNLGPFSGNYQTVVQPQTITTAVNDVNDSVYGLIRNIDDSSIWANYRLKGVQGHPTSDQTTEDYYLANIVVESSQPGIQLFTGTLVYGGVPVCEPGEIPPTDNKCPSGTSLTLTNNRTADSTFADNGPDANVSIATSTSLPAPKYTMGGCMGCHGAAQQGGKDFSFLASGVVGNGKELDSVPEADLSAAAAQAHNFKMSQTNNFKD